jgi:hypothetical protein
MARFVHTVTDSAINLDHCLAVFLERDGAGPAPGYGGEVAVVASMTNGLCYTLAKRTGPHAWDEARRILTLLTLDSERPVVAGDEH